MLRSVHARGAHTLLVFSVLVALYRLLRRMLQAMAPAVAKR